MDNKPDRARMNEALEPVKLFDDVYYIGRRGVGVLAVKTDEGIVFIDAMDPNDAAEKYMIPGLEKIGWGDEPVLAMLLTHGHGDHIAGARHMQDKYGCKVALSWVDSAFMITSPMHAGTPAFEYPRIDFVLEDGGKYVFGGKPFYAKLTAGHTPGCISIAFPVKDGDEEHMAAVPGGGGVPFEQYEGGRRTDFTKACQYVNGAYMFRNFCVELGVDAILSAHPHRSGELELAAARVPGGPNPVVIGKEAVLKYSADYAMRGVDAILKRINEEW